VAKTITVREAIDNAFFRLSYTEDDAKTGGFDNARQLILRTLTVNAMSSDGCLFFSYFDNLSAVGALSDTAPISIYTGQAFNIFPYPAGAVYIEGIVNKLAYNSMPPTGRTAGEDLDNAYIRQAFFSLEENSLYVDSSVGEVLTVRYIKDVTEDTLITLPFWSYVNSIAGEIICRVVNNDKRAAEMHDEYRNSFEQLRDLTQTEKTKLVPRGTNLIKFTPVPTVYT